jgi:hypothetical protein
LPGAGDVLGRYGEEEEGGEDVFFHSDCLL